MRRPAAGLGLLAIGLAAGVPAEGQEAIVDTARPFAAGATEEDLFLRSPVGWPTYQAGVADGLFYRFDPDGYARFGSTEQLDTDFWEVTCTPRPVECAAQRGPLSARVQPDGAPVLAMDALGPAARLRLGGVEAPARTLTELSSPSNLPDLFKANVLLPAAGGEPVPIDGLGAVLAYMRWVEAGQPEDLRLDAAPKRQTAPGPAADAPSAGNVPPLPRALTASEPPVSEPKASPGAGEGLGTVAAPPGAVAGGEARTAIGSAARPQQTTPSAPSAMSSRPVDDGDPVRPKALPGPKEQSQKGERGTRAGSTISPAPGSMDCASGNLPQNAPISRPVASLRGLTGLQLVTDFLAEPENLKGKLRPAVRDLAEERLQAAGLRLFGEDEVEQVPGKPRLELYFTRADAARGCPFRVWLSLRQDVGLARDTGIRVFTGTWGDGGAARPGPAQGAEVETFAHYVDRFVQAWRDANGGQPGAPRTSSSLPPPVRVTDAVGPRPKQLKAYFEDEPAQPAPAPAGDDPDLVLGIQRALGDAGYDPGTADGVAGRRTRAAIRAFERDHGLPITGAANRTVLDRLVARRAGPLP